jgi:hypothetical protein
VAHTWTSVLSVSGSGHLGSPRVAFWLPAAEVLEAALARVALHPVPTWLLALVAAAAVLFWHNLVSLRPYLPSETRSLLAVAATLVSTAAAAFFVMGLFHYSFGRRGALVSYLISTVTLAAAMTIPLLMRSRPAPEAPIRCRSQDDPLTRWPYAGIKGASVSAAAVAKKLRTSRVSESGLGSAALYLVIAI